jgi:hypothetical protein
MMKRNGKIFGLTFLWLAGLVILLHAVIPHHHHYAANAHCFAEKAHSTEDVSHVEHNCHAFNEIISEDKGSIIQKIQKQAFLSFSSLLTVTETGKFSGDKNIFYFSFRDTLKISLFLKSSRPVRGSPLV